MIIWKYQHLFPGSTIPSQISLKQVYEHDHLEHKPLFNELGVFAFRNLLNYQICLETLKTLISVVHGINLK